MLLALDVPFTAVHGSIRFSLSRYNTDQDVDTVIEIFPEIVDSLRSASINASEVESGGCRSAKLRSISSFASRPTISALRPFANDYTFPSHASEFGTYPKSLLFLPRSKP